MSDMLKTIEAKSDQMNADDLVGGGKTITITDAKVTNSDQPVILNYEGDEGKPFKPCKSVRRVLAQIWGINSIDYIGKSMTVFRDPDVKYAGKDVGGIRVSHMSDMVKPVTMAITVSRQNKRPYTVKPLVVVKARTKAVIIAEGVKAKDAGVWGKELNSADKVVATANWAEIKKLRGE